MWNVIELAASCCIPRRSLVHSASATSVLGRINSSTFYRTAASTCGSCCRWGPSVTEIPVTRPIRPFAGNHLLLSLETLQAEGLLSASDLTDAPPFPPHRVEYDAVSDFKQCLLWKAFETFQRSAAQSQRDDLAAFQPNVRRSGSTIIRCSWR